MVDHPCKDGLTAACFKAYPKWARQALAYKLLHILLPKQLTRRLPTMPFPPNFSWPDAWNGWLVFDLPPGTPLDQVFPQGWKPGDELPPGVTIKPGETIPPEWTPAQIPPEFYVPGYIPIEVPEETGALPPLYVGPFSPGPIGGPHTSPPAEFIVGDLLAELNTHALSLQLGYAFVYFDRALAIETDLNAEIHAIDAMVGKVSNPIDSINLQIWNANGSYQPTSLLTDGTSEDIVGSTLPIYDTFQDYVRFYFYDKPKLLLANKYAIVAHRTGDNSTSLYYRVGTSFTGAQYTYARLVGTTWLATSQRKMIYKIWGKSL